MKVIDLNKFVKLTTILFTAYTFFIGNIAQNKLNFRIFNTSNILYSGLITENAFSHSTTTQNLGCKSFLLFFSRFTADYDGQKMGILVVKGIAGGKRYCRWTKHCALQGFGKGLILFL